MKKIFYILPLFLIFLFPFSSQNSSSVQAKEKFNFISTQDLAKGIKEKSLVIIDANTAETFKAGHIPTAVHMKSSEPDAKLLPADKKTALVFYCKNPKCLASHEAADFAQKQGYTNIQIYSLGIDGWKEAGMSVEK